MADRRSVSPIGASRFEAPYEPPRSVHNSAAASPMIPAPSSMPFSVRTSSRAAPSDSLFSHADTMETAPTSISSDDNNRPYDERDSMQSPVEAVSADEWFSRFRSDDDIDVLQSDECPDRATLAAVNNVHVYDAEGNARSFGSLYEPAFATHQRQLIIFVRHFYCGACQAYLKALAEHISMQEYFTIPVPTSIIVIGCGEPNLIPHYKTFTGCPFPMFADPDRSLFKKLGMKVTVNLGGERPEYMKDISVPAWAAGQFKTVHSSLKDPDGIRKRDILKGGHPLQIGGEFLFEEGQVVWCHRMKNMRNHAEVKVIRKLLELDD